MNINVSLFYPDHLISNITDPALAYCSERPLLIFMNTQQNRYVSLSNLWNTDAIFQQVLLSL